MLTDDIVICGERMEQVENSLKRWRYAPKRIRVDFSRSETE